MGIIQPVASIGPAAQAQAEASDTSERLLLTAVSAGPRQPAPAPGFPKTSTSRIFGATSAIGKIKGLSMSQVHDAFGSQAPWPRARCSPSTTGREPEAARRGPLHSYCHRRTAGVVAKVTGRGLPENITGRLAQAG
ncbi:hypothetical protein LX32DRAFT_689527 [Colletotrichum zoysiae]|uniref:Uncharacterized protein n=1 Tax=Colletotrichum zoysiae TaxID=1216348 RepID=A0AAD9HTC1_9PEZI|nr:hypothetical protein LX32DRAFT_689527 [Colletotrichum zoysiae]